MPTTPSLLHGSRLLVAEDDYLIAEQLAQELRAEGAEVLGPASTLAEALRLAGSEPRPNGAILDVNLDGEMVFPLVDLLRGRGVPVVFVTGYDAAAIPRDYAIIPRCMKPARLDAVIALLGHG